MTSIPKPEYPRPDIDRSHLAWQSLNGQWAFAYDDGDVGIQEGWHRSGSESKFDKKIIVPFAHQTEASGLNDKTSHEIVWYSRHVPVPSLIGSDRLLLNFEAVDYECWVWASGSLVAHHLGGNTPFSADITDAAKEGKDVPVVVRVRDAPNDLTQPRGKQFWHAQPEGIWYHPTTGIWQSVWTQVVPRHRLERFVLTPDIDAGTIRIEAHVTPGTTRRYEGAALKVDVSLGDKHIASSTTKIAPETSSVVSTTSVLLPGSLPEVSMRKKMMDSGAGTPEVGRISWAGGLALWSPEHPTLYTVKLSLVDSSSSPIDTVSTYAGMRKVSIVDGRFMLNNAPYFQALSLDQGYWPTSGLTAPSDEALITDIRLMKDIGLNGVRKHQKVEEARFLYHADRMGYLVWSEMANAYEYSSDYAERFVAEWTECVRRDQSHPCIVAWVPINESWGVPALPSSSIQRDHLISLYHLTKTLDPTRPVVDNDGWEHVKTDLATIHDYAEFHVLQKTAKSLDLVLAPKAGKDIFVGGAKYEGQPILVSEMGGVAIKGGAEGWGYNTATSQEDLLARIRGLVDAVLQGIPQIQGFVWTQTTDVLQEVNGLVTADRKHKLDPKLLKDAIGRRR